MECKTPDPSKGQEHRTSGEPTPTGSNSLMLNLVSESGWKGLSNAIFGVNTERAFSR